MKYKVNGQIVIANSIGDAIKVSNSITDSAASDIVREIKSKYPQVKVRQIAKEYNSPYRGRYHQTTLEFSNYPGEGATGFGNDPRTKDRDNWVKLLKYLYTKYTGEKDELNIEVSVGYDRVRIYEDIKKDSANDSEEVEDLATVDKTFLLTLTRKIISNIQSDNFSTAQTQAKELERYINNVSYADSVDDSVKDGRTYTNCVLWLKRALDDVQGYHSVDAISKLNKVIFWLKNDPNFVDSVDDSIKDRDITKAEESEIARELTRRFNIKFTTTGESAVEASIGIWANSELDKKIVKYLKSKGYKVEWDSIGDDGYYYLMK